MKFFPTESGKYEDDPVNYAPGESSEMCQECSGTGIERWCPKCGKDYRLAKKAAVAHDERLKGEGK